MLAFYDENQVAFSGNPLRTFHDGHLGGSYESKIYLRNSDSGKYYVNVTVHFVSSSYEDLGEFGTTGWSTKFIYGERAPTEDEWDRVRPGDAIAIPDIGSTVAADTYTYHPIWIRVYCPGGESAQNRTNQSVKVYFFERNVGA